MLKHVIIGNGPAGIEAARTIRTIHEDDEIVVLSDEAHISYSRFLLPDYIAGRIPLERLWLQSESYYREAKIELRLRTKVASVHSAGNSVTTADGERMEFDQLLIACGGKPKLPDINGIAESGALTLKTLADAQNILSRVKARASVLVLGRDLIGVEMARAFCQMGTRVTYIAWENELLPNIIDPATAEELSDKMRAAGVKMVLGEEILRMKSTNGTVSVDVAGKTLSADVLVVAVGMEPSLDSLNDSGIMVGSGVTTDERLRTNKANIYAAGDVAEIYDPRVHKRKLLFGWKNANEQGRIAGANMCGEDREFEIKYAPGVKQIFGVDVRHRWK
ncbi:MAG: NAD(P)/FAD-dependent oxidoreductase [Candidatus Abyssobacteria bacterium SURF_17]|uniref:NAD(P)/FAD-dependent oxidoreductase n=1 Tax=Candidatus Abyssobacteria bacterium SURF_17 TaxID=2093361 RepID=A0A419EVV1_9BACT|nr:MAG: NAD(P)/FAD-dependent oxidoreductase [Candidatus Abyssubacteria bacterium SURF_17]